MRIICPNCQTSYTLADKTEINGRKMKCAKCAHIWRVVLTKSKSNDAVAQKASDEEQRAGSLSTVGYRKFFQSCWVYFSPFQNFRALILAFGVFSSVLFMSMLYGQRETIVSYSPKFSSFYGILGISVIPQGLEFEDVRAVLQVEDGEKNFVVEGLIRNKSKRSLAIPRLYFVFSEQNQEIHSWHEDASRGELAQGEDLLFQATLYSPPSAEKVHIKFLDDNIQGNPL